MNEHVNSLNILHNFQIGFLPKNQTTDHALTLRPPVDKYVHHHNEKNLCLSCRLLKTFPLSTLLQINFGGWFFFLNLIKSLYSDLTNSINQTDKNETRPFPYVRWVRQGCILSSLLFNQSVLMTCHSLLKKLYLIPLSYQKAQN